MVSDELHSLSALQTSCCSLAHVSSFNPMINPTNQTVDCASIKMRSHYISAFDALNWWNFLSLDDKRDLMQYFQHSKPELIFSWGDLSVLPAVKQVLLEIKYSSTSAESKWTQAFLAEMLDLLATAYKIHKENKPACSENRNRACSSAGGCNDDFLRTLQAFQR